MSKQNKILFTLGAIWLLIFALAAFAKVRAGYMGLPFISFALLGYIAWVTLKFPTGNEQTTETQENTKNEQN